MKIAIVGSGFAGLALAWALHKNFSFSITVFDKGGFRGGASRTAAGLVHPYTSKRLTLARDGQEAFDEAVSLFKEASVFQEEDFILHRGMIRLFLEQEEAGLKTATDYHDDLAPIPAIFVENALTIDTNLYLNALMKGLTRVQFIEKNVTSLDELEGFDAIILTTGYETLGFKEAANLPFSYLKGQGLEIALPKGMEPLKYAVSSEIYVTMMKDGKLFAGATFERGLSDPEADENLVKERILPKLATLFPRLTGIKPIGIRSGVRLTTKGYYPLTKQIGPKLWVFSGLGSKGLLYHAFLAKQLAKTWM